MCVGQAVDKLLPDNLQPGKAPGSPKSLEKFVPTLGESLDPHYFRTNSKAEERHKKVGVHKYDTGDIPDPPPPIPIPQSAKAPNTLPLRRRNSDGGFAMPNGSTALTGPSGVAMASMNLGSASKLGG